MQSNIQKNLRLWLVAGGVMATVMALVWLVTSRDGEKPGELAEVNPEPTPRFEVPALDEDPAMTEMRELGYIVAEEPDGQTETPTAGTGRNRVSARRLQNLGASLAGAGDLAGAEDAFRGAIAADPTYRPPHYALAELLRRTDRFDEADREFWTSVDLGLGEPTTAIVKVATQYRNRGELERAGRILDEGRRRYPESADIWLHFGAFFGEAGDYQKALRCLRRAVMLAPDDPLAYRNLAAAQVALGDRDGARRSLTEGLRRDPENREIKKMLAELGGSDR
jgi:Flp pilus assembly protein TadD